MCVVSVQGVLAQRYIGLSANAGEHSWLGTLESGKLSGSYGAGGGLGFHFEAQRNHFLFTFGVQGNVHHSVFGSEEQVSFWADDGDPQIAHSYNPSGIYGNFTYQYDFYDRKDQYTNVVVQVPLMFGGQFGHFYFLLGAKLQTMTLWGQASAKAMFNSRGIYAGMYPGASGVRAFEHMPEHGFFDEQPIAPQKMGAKFNLNALAAGELGYTTTSRSFLSKTSGRMRQYQMRVGAYFDYGLLNDCEYRPDGPAYTTPTYNAATASEDMKNVQMIHLLASANRAEIIRPMQVGVKFTVLFQLPQPKMCVICEQNLEPYRYW